MKENITKEDALRLREEFIQYTERAEQHEWIKLFMIHIKLDCSISNFDSMDDKEKEYAVLKRLTLNNQNR